MPRTARVAPGGMVFHVLNRGVARMLLFEEATDYEAFEQVLRETLGESPLRVCAYALMPNQWHLLVWPASDGELAAFMQRLTVTHVRRWQQYRGYAGLGHVCQGRYKSTSISGLWRGTWSAMHCARIWSRERKIGGGPVCGDGATERRWSNPCWQLGPLKCHRIRLAGYQTRHGWLSRTLNSL
jgi:REP element-mobilizing transposase RayT